MRQLQRHTKGFGIMKTIASIFFGFALTASAQLSLPIQGNYQSQVVTLMYAGSGNNSWDSSPPPVSQNVSPTQIVVLNSQNGGYTVFSLPSGANSIISSTGGNLQYAISGVTNISYVSASGAYSQYFSPNYSFATYTILTPITNSPTVVSNYIPADAVVIPASATGNVQIILESSPDLVNWTAANPGIYGASAATNRFFRVRAVAQ